MCLYFWGQAKKIDVITDHLGNGRVWWRWNESTNQPEVLQTADYYPFGLEHADPSSYQIGGVNAYKFQGQEHQTDHDLGWISFKWRNHDPTIGRFFNVDPIAENYYYNSPYAFSENKVTTHIELEGLEAVYIFDQNTRPNDNGVAGTSYTGQAYVDNGGGKVNGPYSISTYPNSISLSNNATTANTVNEGHIYTIMNRDIHLVQGRA